MSALLLHFAFGTALITLFAVCTPLVRRMLERVTDPDPFLLASPPCLTLTAIFAFALIEFGFAVLSVQDALRYLVAAAAIGVTFGFITGGWYLLGHGRVRPGAVPMGSTGPATSIPS